VKNLAIDPELLDEALRVGGHRTKTATVNEALEEYVRRRKQREIVELFGTLEYDEDHDYKAQRSREGS
jgi:Arc/MetJ family transcription regulator